MTDTERGSLQTECEANARRFGQSLQQGEFEQAVDLFDADAAVEFVDSLKNEHGGLAVFLSDDPAFVLRRCRHAIYALNGSIEAVTVVESSVHEEGGTVSIEFDCTNTATQLQVHFDANASIVDLAFPDAYSPPTYADETAFEESPVTIDCGDITLDGVATVPTEPDNPPIALLVLGAGELDNDYTYGPNRFFKDLAWGLATEGIATLRYDKREYVTDIPATDQTLETRYFADGVTALETAASIEGIDSNSVFVIGHSLGGRSAFEIARRYGDVAGVAALDASLMNPLEQDADQYREQLAVDGKLPDFVEALTKQYEAERTRFFEDDYEPDGQVMNIPVSWLDSIWSYDQFDTAAALSAPLFIYQMELELRAPKEKRNRWHDVISEGRDTLIQRPELNHNFQRSEEPGSLLGPVLFHRNVDERVISDLVAWIDDV
jgi:dienelactone hydrolase